MKTASAKAKGRRLQDHVVQTLRSLFGFTADDCRPALMGETGSDVKLQSEFARSRFPFSIECKNTERLNLWDSLKQCEANAEKGLTPLLIFSRNRSRVYAVVELERLLPLLK